MPYYETVFMARQDLSEKQVQEQTDNFSKVLKDQGATILKTENWGLRTLAYRINKSRKAHYVLIESEGPGASVIELERLMRLDEDIMRSQTIRLEEPSKGPSSIIDKSGRDDDKYKKPSYDNKKPSYDNDKTTKTEAA